MFIQDTEKEGNIKGKSRTRLKRRIREKLRKKQVRDYREDKIGSKCMCPKEGRREKRETISEKTEI